MDRGRMRSFDKVRVERQRDNVAAGNGPKGEERSDE